MTSRSQQLGLLALFLLIHGTVLANPTCLYVSSYHAGYPWNDRIEAGLESKLAGVCEIQRFYMDTKRNKGATFASQKALEAKQLIDRSNPDVVIACDDNASKYLIVPHLANTDRAVVFCGVNWTVEVYGFPYPNVTGMIEVAPIRPLIVEARAVLPKAKTLGFISANVPTQIKDADRITKVAVGEGVEFKYWLVDSYEEWKERFLEAQNTTDILILGNPAGINDWSHDTARDYISNHTTSLTVSYGLAMSRHAVFSMAQMPEEQGEWSGDLARLILSGHSPADLPITSNRRWKSFANPGLARHIGVRLSESILQGAEIIESGRP